MSLWKAIKDWIGIASAKEIADLKEAEKKVASAADAAIKQSLENIEALGQKIEAEIDKDVTAVKKRARKAYQDTADMVNTVETNAVKAVKDKKEATKKLATKIVNRKKK
jgi:hypothetical protein